MRLEFAIGLLFLRPLAFGSEPPAPLSVEQARAAGIDPLHDSQEVIKSKLLRSQGIENVPREAERRAKERAKSQGQAWYDYERVEVSGIWSKDDETDVEFDRMFDKRISPSFYQRVSQSDNTIDRIKKKLHNGMINTRRKDMEGLELDQRGTLSPRGREVMQELRGKQVNELVCHSWGSEIVYNAIFEGLIDPPNVIVVVGAPDNDIEKWRALALYTGTSVLYLKNSSGLGDVVAKVGAGYIAAPARNPQDILRDWKARCPTLESCRRRGAAGPGTFVDRKPKTGDSFPGHDRLKYYEAIREMLPTFQTPAVEMRKPQILAIANEKRHIEQAVSDDAHRLAVTAVMDDTVGDPFVYGDRRTASEISKILDGAAVLRERSRMRTETDGEVEWTRNNSAPAQAAVPGAAPNPPALAPVPEFLTAPTDAWALAELSCRRGRISQDDIDLAISKLHVYKTSHRLLSMKGTDCARRLFQAMNRAADTGRSVTVTWFSTIGREGRCKAEAENGTAEYRETVRLARQACETQAGIDEQDLSALKVGRWRNHEPAVPVGQLRPCVRDLYLMICAGNSDGGPWSADEVNERARELANRDAREDLTRFGQAIEPDNGRGRDRDDRLKGHDIPSRTWNPTFHPN